MQIKKSWTSEASVAAVVKATGCTLDDAVGYLIAEEGDITDAIRSYRGDRS